MKAELEVQKARVESLTEAWSAVVAVGITGFTAVHQFGLVETRNNGKARALRPVQSHQRPGFLFWFDLVNIFSMLTLIKMISHLTYPETDKEREKYWFMLYLYRLQCPPVMSLC